jgi:hypothetical protein
MASHTSVAASAFAALFLLSAAAVAAEPKLFSRAGYGQKFDAYLVSKESTGLGKNHFANVRFVSQGKKSSTAEWIVNCNQGFPQVVSPSNINTFLKVKERPAAKDRFKYELWFAVCEGKTQHATEQTPQPSEDCPVDRLVFRDDRTNRQFVSERVAVDYRYICDGKITKAFDRPQKELAARCQGPYGDTVIEGLLDGKKAHAVYSVADAAPCCVWYSHKGAFKPDQGNITRWLKSNEAWSVQLGDEWYVIGPSNPPYEDDRGPMGGGEFRPVACMPR